MMLTFDEWIKDEMDRGLSRLEVDQMRDAWNAALAAGVNACCGNPSQCWEPCGDLGKSEEHAVPIDGVLGTSAPLRFHQWPEAAKVAYERLEQRLNGDEAALLYQLQQAFAAGVNTPDGGRDA